MVHAATHVENNMDSEMEVTSCSKDKGKKTCLDGVQDFFHKKRFFSNQSHCCLFFQELSLKYCLGVA